MNWVVAVVGLGGLGVTALALVLNYRERSAGLRGALYAKQVEAYGVLLLALADLHGVVIEFTSAKTYPLDSRSRADLRSEAQEQIAGVAHAFTENVVFVPVSVANAVAKYRATFLAITAPAMARSQYPPELYDSTDPQADLTEVFERVWEVMRHELGTDPLSQQTHKLIGAPPLAT